MIDICQGPSEGMGSYIQTPYIYSSNYPHPLPNVLLTCECLLSASQSGYSPYISAVLMQFRGQATGDEQVVMEFMYPNDATKIVLFEFSAHDDSASRDGSNTLYDLTQSMRVTDNFTRWTTIRLRLMKYHSSRSAGRYMFMFGKTTRVQCATLDISINTQQNSTTDSTITISVGGETEDAEEITFSTIDQSSTEAYKVTVLPASDGSEDESAKGFTTVGILVGISAFVIAVIFITVVVFGFIVFMKRKQSGRNRVPETHNFSNTTECHTEDGRVRVVQPYATNYDTEEQLKHDMKTSSFDQKGEESATHIQTYAQVYDHMNKALKNPSVTELQQENIKAKTKAYVNVSIANMIPEYENVATICNYEKLQTHSSVTEDGYQNPVCCKNENHQEYTVLTDGGYQNVLFSNKDKPRDQLLLYEGEDLKAV